MIGVVGAALLAALITMFLTPPTREWCFRVGGGLVDMPGGRRVNEEPMPRGGGIPIFFGFMVSAALAILVRQLRLPHAHVWTPQVTGVLLGTLCITLCGFVDDLKSLSPKLQILAMVGASLILIAFGVRVEGISNPFKTGEWLALNTLGSGLITVFWVLVVTKTVDAIDGLDGLAAGVCTICAMTLALMATQLKNAEGPTIALIAAALVGSCIGFLRHNYHPAKIIMGTVGAYVLGFVLASLSIMGAFKVAATVSVAVPILVLGVPIFDFTHVLARRFMAKAPLTQADKRHLHHRLLARGWNQRQVAWTIYGITFLFCAVALIIFQTTRVGR